MENSIQTPEMLSPESSQDSDKRHPIALKILVLLGIEYIMFVLIAGFLVLFYTDYSLISPPKTIQALFDELIIKTPLPKTSRLVLNKSVRTMQDIDTSLIEAGLNFENFNLSLKDNNENPYKISFQTVVKGWADLKKSVQDNAQANVKMEVSAEGANENLESDVIVIGNELYEKNIVVPNALAYTEDFLKDIKSTWIKYDGKYLQGNENKINIIKNLNLNNSIVVDVLKELDDWKNVKINRQSDTYEISFVPSTASINSVSKEQDRLIGYQNDDLSNSTQDLKPENITEASVSVSIDRKSFQIKSFSMIVKVIDEKVDEEFKKRLQIPIDEEIIADYDFAYTVKYEDYNKPISVSAPSDYETYEDFLSKYSDLFRDQLLQNMGNAEQITTSNCQLRNFIAETPDPFYDFVSTLGNCDAVYIDTITRAENAYLESNFQELLNLALQSKSNASTDFQKGVAIFMEGRYHHGVRNYQDSITFMKEAIQYAPQFASPYSIMSNDYNLLGDYQQAESIAKKCLEINKLFPFCYSHLSEALFQQGRIEEGFQVLDTALMLAPNSVSIQEAYNSAQQRFGQ